MLNAISVFINTVVSAIQFLINTISALIYFFTHVFEYITLLVQSVNILPAVIIPFALVCVWMYVTFTMIDR